VQIYFTTCDDLESKLRRTPSIREIADELGIDVGEAIELRGEATALTHLAPLTNASEVSEGRVLGAATASPTPSEWAESQEMSASVKAALRRLTERQRQVLVLYFLEGLAKSEVADILGIGRSRVTQLVQQGLLNLRAELGIDQVNNAEDLLPDQSAT
jgi:RNA polymerase sigma factor for flagellar operon FliA